MGAVLPWGHYQEVMEEGRVATTEETTFGALLRRYRRARALSQGELAERAGLSPRSISDLERGIRRLPYPETLRLLIDALALTDHERTAMIDAVTRERSRPSQAGSSTPHVPDDLQLQPTVFLGREGQVEALKDLLLAPQSRLVTLTGTGGVGKTRLGLRVAEELLQHFAGGVHLVRLAPLSEPSLVATTIAQSLGVSEAAGSPPVGSLAKYLRDKQMLLVLDNFEHLLDAALDVSELLASCPRLKVLVTSRAPLRIRGEQEYLVPPLELPIAEHFPIIGRLLENESVSLFVQRAKDVKSDFDLTEADATAVVEICRRLEGLPLAIELAAARVKLLPPQALLPRLGSRLALLTGGPRDLPARQRTIRDTIDWSYKLLEPRERVLFARLAVFVGGCTLNAAEAVCHISGDVSDVLDRLGSLVDKSLVQRLGEDARCRFWMLETIAELAAEKLEESGAGEALRRRHAEYFLELSEKVEPELDGPQQAVWLDRLEAERDNVRAALEWALRENTELAARLCSALWLYWYDHGYIREGRRWMESAVARSQSLPVSVRIKLLNTTGDLAWSQADYGRAAQLLEEALGLAREGGSRRDMTLSLNHLGNVAIYKGEYERAIRLLDESLVLEREVRDRRGIAASLTSLGTAVLYKGDCERAMRLLEESLSIERQDGNLRGIAAVLTGLGNAALCMNELGRATQLLDESLMLKRHVGNKRGMAISLNSLARVALHQGDAQKAEQLLQEGLALSWQLGDQHTVASSLELLCQVATAGRATERAIRLGGAAEALRKRFTFTITPIDSPHHDRCVRELQSQMDRTVFDSAWQTGMATALDGVIESALTKVFVDYQQPGDLQR